MSFDIFVAELRCPVCGAVSPEDTSTNMQTKLQATPANSYLRVGDRLELRKDGPENGGYLKIRDRLPDEPMRLLETWECPNCESPYNWAEIVIRDEVIEGIHAVELDRETLGRAHFISWMLGYVYQALTDQPLYVDNALRPDFVEALREHLPQTAS